MRQATLIEFLNGNRYRAQRRNGNELDLSLLEFHINGDLEKLAEITNENRKILLDEKDVVIEKRDDGIHISSPHKSIIVDLTNYKMLKTALKLSGSIADVLATLFAIRVKDQVFIFFKKHGEAKGTDIVIKGVSEQDVEVINPDGEIIEIFDDDYEKLKELAQGRLPIVADIPFGSEMIRVDYEVRISYLVTKTEKFKPVILGVPIEVQMLMVPDFPTAKWRVTWKTTDGRDVTLVGLLPEIISAMRQNGMIANKTKAEDVISALLVQFIANRIGKVEYDYDKPGFYPMDNTVKAVGIELPKPDEKELRKALKLLNELANKWYADRIEKFATIIKWGVVAPFSFVMKKWNKSTDIVFPWVYLWGTASSGKTTMARIVLMLWGLGSRNIIGGAMIDNLPRFGQIVSSTTMPIVANEVILEKAEVIDAIKASIEGTVARGKFIAGNYVIIPALAPLIMTSNRMPPMDAGLLRRLIVMNFTPKEKIRDERKKKEFAKVLEKAEVLKAVGGFVAWFISEHSELLRTKPWHEIARIALEKAYEYAKLPKPKWLNMLYLGEQDSEDLTEELVIGKIKDLLVDCLSKLKRKWEADMDFENAITVIDIIASSNMCSWISKPRNGDYVYLLAPILTEINKVLTTQLSLKALAEILEGDYVKVKGRMVVKIDVEQLASKLVMEE